MTLLAIYEKVEGLLRRLPEGLNRPILRELEPLKTLFLEQRAPRLVLLGDRTVSRGELVNHLYDAEAARPTEDIGQSGTWENFSLAGRGALQVLDARRPIKLPILSRPLSTDAPDSYLFVRGSGKLDETCAADLDHAVEVLTFADGQHSVRPKLLGVQVGDQATEEERLELHGALFTKPELAERTAGALLDANRAKLVEQIA